MQEQLSLGPMYSAICQDAARGKKALTELKARRYTNSLDDGIASHPVSHTLDELDSALRVDGVSSSERGGHVESIGIHVDHDDHRRCVQLGHDQRRQANRSGTNDSNGRARLDLAIEDAAF